MKATHVAGVKLDTGQAGVKLVQMHPYFFSLSTILANEFLNGPLEGFMDRWQDHVELCFGLSREDNQ